MSATSSQPSQVIDAWWVEVSAPDAGIWDPALSGKWLVFVPAAQVDDWWAVIRAAVEVGTLGPTAKAATARLNPNARDVSYKVICVYTDNWQDKDDVRRVLAGLRDLGVGWRLSYKADSTTLADRYGPGTAIYVSAPGSVDFDDRTPRGVGLYAGSCARGVSDLDRCTWHTT